MVTATRPSCQRLGGQVNQYEWFWQSKPLQITSESLGEGSPILLLPPFSTVSTRAEVAPLARALATRYQAIALDWPGFGDSDRPPVDYGPELYGQFLQAFVEAHFSEPIRVVAAGHAAGYVLQLATAELWSKLVLVAPTWQGPLAVMGAPASLRSGVCQLVRSPLVGQALYYLNTRPAFLKWMFSRHVFADAQHITPELLIERYQGTQKPGARYAPAGFVTGQLDPFTAQSDWLALTEATTQKDIPIMVVLAEQAPPSSKANMEALAAIEAVQSVRLPGSLGMVEEQAGAIATAIFPFLAE
ncbi:MAG: alpha/beta hydrolase [Cyanobacteria bacterium P01_H01_bin.121]